GGKKCCRGPSMSDIEREYEYKPKWTGLLACGGFFALCALLVAHRAYRNDRGLIINGIIELSPDNATLFYWALCALSIGFVLLSVPVRELKVEHSESVVSVCVSSVVGVGASDGSC